MTSFKMASSIGSSSDGSEDKLFCVFSDPGSVWLFLGCELLSVSRVSLDVDNLLDDALATIFAGMLLELSELLDVFMIELAFEEELLAKKLFSIDPFDTVAELPVVNIDFVA